MIKTNKMTDFCHFYSFMSYAWIIRKAVYPVAIITTLKFRTYALFFYNIYDKILETCNFLSDDAGSATCIKRNVHGIMKRGDIS